MKQIKIVLFVSVLGFLSLLAWWVLSAGPQTVWKIISSDTSGIEDYKIFPSRVLIASENPFHFERGLDKGQIPENITRQGSEINNLEEFLLDLDTTAFLIIKDDVILMEYYGQGYGASTPSLGFSMSKSILSILIGMAIDDELINSVNQPVTDFVPELLSSGFEKVTIRHLLQMTSGIDYVEVEGNSFSLHNRFYYTNRLEYEVLRLELGMLPGIEFSYKSGENALLGLILSRALGEETITDYTQARLWEPLGMEFGGAWNLDHSGGLEKTWCCLSATARDYAKFGRLYLNNGNWNGKQVISSEWVKQSTAIDTQDGSIWNYQYQWWLVSEGGNDYIAMGHQGQFVYVNPDKKIIIVRLGTSRGGLEWDEWKVIFSSLAQVLEE